MAGRSGLAWGRRLILPRRARHRRSVWKGKSKDKWKWGESDGIFLQLEAPGGIRQMYFTQLKTKKGQLVGVGETELLDVADFELFPRLFK